MLSRVDSLDEQGEYVGLPGWEGVVMGCVDVELELCQAGVELCAAGA